jgi:hypothetical protein
MKSLGKDETKNSSGRSNHDYRSASLLKQTLSPGVAVEGAEVSQEVLAVLLNPLLLATDIMYALFVVGSVVTATILPVLFSDCTVCPELLLVLVAGWITLLFNIRGGGWDWVNTILVRLVELLFNRICCVVSVLEELVIPEKLLELVEEMTVEPAVEEQMDVFNITPLVAVDTTPCVVLN